MLYHLLHIPFTPSLKPHALSLTPQALSLKPYPLNKIKHALLLLAFLLVGVTSAMAQLHPIQLNLICPPTLPGSVNGLYQANGLKATLTLLDKYQPSLEVGVGFTMKGNGVTIEKRPDYLGETPTLLFAMPKVLGEDFFSSLLQEGVSYNGPNRDAFESKGTLTSGRYELTLWAYDLNRPAVRISNLARVYLWIQKSNPPTLTFPLDKAIVYAIPQQFSWTVAPSSNGLTTPRYKFLLYELNDPNRDPADEVMSSEPFFEEEVAAPTFSYLTYHPQLIRGKGYAWRIQAVAYDQNQQEIPLFNNNGFSAIRSFSYGQDATSTLKQLLAIEAKSKNPYSMDVKVVADPSGKMDTPDGFKLEYRKAGAEEWSQVEVDDDYTTLAKLTPNTEYELRGYPRMGTLYGDAGPMVKARTQSPPEVKCGTKSSYKPDASTKLASLATGDIVTANQIPFTITAVKNSDGSFTGMAFAGVPFFGGKKLAYKLNNATFNSKYELTGGSIVADTIGIERYINKKVAEQAAKQATANEKKGDILADEKTVKVGGDIKDVTSIKVDTSDKEHPKAIVTTVDGKEQVVDIPKNGTITLADSTGEVYTASSDGTVNNIGMYAGAASGTGTMAGSVQQKPKKLYGADLLVEFQPDPQQLYGFDNPFSLGENFWKEKYDTTQVAGRTFFVPAKMVAAGATDKVVATLKGEAADHPENLSFTTTTGMRYMASPGLAKGTLQLTLAGGAPDSRQELTAWMKQGDSTVAVGRLSIDAFQSISRRVVVVPVGDATYDQAAALAEGLNGIYKQAGVRWDATVADQVLPMPEGVGESIKVDKSLFSAYSAGMRRIRSAFCSTSTYQRLGDQDIYYIFLTTLPMNGEDENAPFDGYMPYGKPFGFVRSAGMGATELAWTIAHELGHGAFHLQHVWKEQGYTTDTRNLMGYSKTGELFRWQWQDIHHPVSHSNLLADEEDLGFVAQIAKCIGAAAVDVAFNYTFKWVELWYDGNEPVEFTDFGTIFSKINKAELFSSAAIACATSVIPWPTDKAKTVATLTAAMGAGAVAITGELYNQYEYLTQKNKNIAFGEILNRLDWQKALVKGGTQAVIAGVATGVVMYAATHPKFLNFAAKLRKIGYEPLKKRLAKAGITGDAFEAFCKKFGIKSSQNASKWMDEIYEVQKSIVSKNRNLIASANNNAKGAFGEIATDAHLVERGFKPLHQRKNALTEGWGETGIDGIFLKDGKYYIVEAKYKGKAKLNTLKDGTKQMSDKWIKSDDRILRAVKGNSMIADEIITSNYKRVLAEVAPDGSIVFKELNAKGEILDVLTF